MSVNRGRETLPTDYASWIIGPYHGALPGPMRLRLRLDGEIIVTAEAETGFLHRGLEKAMELHLWGAAPAYADRLDPETAAFQELALCRAVEEIAEISVPERAAIIRLIAGELTRISSHFAFIARLARAVNAETMLHYVLRDRERILDLFELLTGARFALNFLRYGGVAADVTDGFLERVLETCELVRFRLKEYNDLFSFNEAFLRRTVYIGVIPGDFARQLGVSGPNARASGVMTDLRKEDPRSGYERIDFEVPLGQGDGGTVGDAYDRYLVRLREIAQSVEILKQLVEDLPRGPYCSLNPGAEPAIPAGEAYARVEGPRGLIGCHVVSDGGLRPARVQYRVPSMAALRAIPAIVAGARLEDLPVILASLDLSLAEVDR